MDNESTIPDIASPKIPSPIPRITTEAPVMTREPNYDLRKPVDSKQSNRGYPLNMPRPAVDDDGYLSIDPSMVQTAYNIDGFQVSEEEFMDYADTGVYPARLTELGTDEPVYFIEDESGRRQVTKEEYENISGTVMPDGPAATKISMEPMQATPKLGDSPDTPRPVPRTTPTTNRVKNLINPVPTSPGTPIPSAPEPTAPTSMVEPDTEQAEPTLMARASESLNIAKDKVMSTPYLGSTLAAASKGASAMYDGVAKLGGYQDPKEKEENNKPIVMNNSTSSSTNNTTTINKYDTDTISKWRSGYVDQVHKPGHYSLYS